MKKHHFVANFTLMACFLGLLAPLKAQNAGAHCGDSDHAKRSLAVNLLRAINTAEMNYRLNHGSYAPWDVLLTSQEFTNVGMKWAAKNDPQLAELQLSKGPETLPGWSLRLDLNATGKGYDVILEDTTDKTCGYAAITDERGLIRQSKAIGCRI